MIESLIVTLIVVWSMYIVFKKLLPTRYRRVMQTLAGWCEQKGWYRLAKKLAPPMTIGCSGGCGCKAESPANSQPVKWKN